MINPKKKPQKQHKILTKLPCTGCFELPSLESIKELWVLKKILIFFLDKKNLAKVGLRFVLH